MNHQEQHLSLSVMAAYSDGVLNKNRAADVREHLDNCQACADMNSIAVQLREITASSEIVQPSASLIERVTKAAVKKMGQGSSKVAKVLPQIADSQLGTLATGMRGAMQNRQVLYADGNSMVNIEVEHIAPDNELYTIRGQVSVTDLDIQELIGIEVQLANDNGFVRRCITDQLGQFRMSGLQNGRYRLTIEQATHHSIVVESIEF